MKNDVTRFGKKQKKPKFWPKKIPKITTTKKSGILPEG